MLPCVHLVHHLSYSSHGAPAKTRVPVLTCVAMFNHGHITMYSTDLSQIHGLFYTKYKIKVILHQSSWTVAYLLKTFFSSLERAVLAVCFRSVRLGCFLFLPFPFPAFLPFPNVLEEPRSSPVAASISLMSSGSRQSKQKRVVTTGVTRTIFL